MANGHSAGPKAQLKYIASVLAAGTVMAFAFLVLLDTWLLVIAVGIGWGVVGIYSIILFGVIEPGGEAIGRVLVSSGGSTPSVNQHSSIEAMEARGELRKAAEAYRAVIESEPQDIVACEKLGQLALRELKDYQLALLAYREAEKRSTESKRQLGYAILVAGIYRDNLKDYGKAMVELRRLLARYPDAPNADALRAEIEEIKAIHFGNQAT